jgi:hypothetical protein
VLDDSTAKVAAGSKGSSGSPRSVGFSLGWSGPHATEWTGVSLAISPEALEFTLGPLAGAVFGLVSLESPVRILRSEVISIRRVWTGAYLLEHRASAPTPLKFGTAFDNARLEADLRAAGYDVQAPTFTRRTRRIVIGTVLGLDAVVLVALVVVPGGSMLWAVPLGFFGTTVVLTWFR